MKPENRDTRKAQIADAAYALIAEKGYLGTSMLAIAKRAKASNETLYRWYGDKQGLFRTLIEANAEQVKTLLEQSLAEDVPPMAVLQNLAPLLLELLTSDRAIALNRAAAADATGELGTTLIRSGRAAVGPLIAQTIAKAQRTGALGGDDALAATRLFMDLLVGDLQIRRVIGAAEALSPADCQKRAKLTLDRLQLLLA